MDQRNGGHWGRGRGENRIQFTSWASSADDEFIRLDKVSSKAKKRLETNLVYEWRFCDPKFVICRKHVEGIDDNDPGMTMI